MWSKWNFLQWIRQTRAGTGSNNRRGHRPRLRVESLEDRTVPAVDPQIAFAAHQELAGPMARTGYDLAELYVEYRAFNLTSGLPPAAFQPTNSLLRVSEGAVAVDALPMTDASTTAMDLSRLGFRLVAQSSAVVSGFLPISSLESAAGLGSVRFLSAEYRPITSNIAGSVSQGVKAIQADTAAQYLGLDGSGVTVGVLSDSYNSLGGAANDIASGDLPGPANPFGHKTPVNVIDDSIPGTDEGRAMLQIVHDVAPGASLAFATAGTSQTQFAQNITQLVNAGVNVIVDDYTFLTEPMFQDGAIAQAVNGAAAVGVAYFSAAGNLGTNSYEQTFRNSGVNLGSGSGGTGQVTTDATFLAHNFNPNGGVDLFQTLTLPPGTTSFSFQWADPYRSITGPSGPGAATDLDIAVFDRDGNFLGIGGFTRNIGNDPIEVFSYTNSTGAPIQVKIAIGKTDASQPDPSLIKYVAFPPGAATGTAAGFSIDTYATNSSTIFGHANAAGAETVGAARYTQTPAYGVTPPVLEPYSSRGGTPILFDAAGNLLAAPQVRQTPGIVAPDGVNTTFFGVPDPIGSGPFEADGLPNFFGTSAAAPHAAAVAALMLQAKPSLTPAQINAALESTAIDMGPPGYDRASGWGLIQAPEAIIEAAGIVPVQFNGTTGNDALSIRRDATGSNLELVRGGVVRFTLPYAKVSGITVNGQGGRDTFTLDESNGPIAVPIHFIGDQLPAARNDTATTPENTPVLIDVLANDVGIGDGPLSLAVITPPANGSAVIANGKIMYIPNTDYNSASGGPDTFLYRVTDRDGQSSTATVTITVTPVNAPPTAFAQYLTLAQGGSVSFVLTGDDGDPEVNQQLTFAIATPPAHGTITAFNPATGAGTYVPDPSYRGPDSFTFTITDDATAGGPALTSTPAVISLQMNGVNHPPVANPDFYNVTAGQSIAFMSPINQPGGVLLNDTDPDGDRLTASVITPPAHGNLIFSPNGSFTYAPLMGFSGTDGFTYRISDGNGGTAIGTATITVIPVPEVPHGIIVTGAGAGGGPHVEVFDAVTGDLKFSFFAYEATYTGGVRVAVGDVDGDGIPDIITATGPGGAARLRVFSGKDLTVLADFYAFEPSFVGGFTVAAGNFDGGPNAEIVVGAGPGAGPRVRTFKLVNGRIEQLAGPLGSFYAFEPSFNGGVNVAAGNYDGSPGDEIIVGAATGGGPRVAVYSATAAMLTSFFAFPDTGRLGVNVAAADLDGDGKADIITGPGQGDGSVVRVFAGGTAKFQKEIQVFDPSYRDGIVVGTVDRRKSGKADILVAPAVDSSTVQVFDGRTLDQLDQFNAYDNTFAGGIYLAGS